MVVGFGTGPVAVVGSMVRRSRSTCASRTSTPAWRPSSWRSSTSSTQSPPSKPRTRSRTPATRRSSPSVASHSATTEPFSRDHTKVTSSSSTEWISTRYSWFSGPRNRDSGALRQGSSATSSGSLARALRRGRLPASRARSFPTSKLLHLALTNCFQGASASGWAPTCQTISARVVVSGPPSATSRMASSSREVTWRSQTSRYTR